jgi:membrane protein required for colicin V production
LNWLDYTFIAILTLSTLFSLRKGLVREALGLVSTVVGLLLAYWFYGSVASFLEPFLSSRRLANFLGFLLIFAGIHLASVTLSWAINKFLKATGLSTVDRLLGGVFGLLRGGAICLALLTAVIAWSPRGERAIAPAAVVNSQVAPALTEASRVAVGLAPMELKQSFQEGYGLLQNAWKKVAGGQGN